METNDLAFLRVKHSSVASTDLNYDGVAALRLAQTLLSSEVSLSNGFGYVQRMKAGDYPNLFAFIRKTDLQRPAGAQNGYVYLTQSYAKAIRVMCLRIWADKSIYRMFGNLEDLYFPKPQLESDVPFGAELLWAHNECAKHQVPFDETLIPAWASSAVQSLCKNRKMLYNLSVEFSLAFSWLHEIGHNDLGHFGPQASDEDNRRKELQADLFAFLRLLRTGGRIPSNERWLIAPALITGVLAAFMVFHVMLVLAQPMEVLDISSQDYPPIRDRISQFSAVLRDWHRTSQDKTMFGFTDSMRQILIISSLHPVYAYVVGTPWVAKIPLICPDGKSVA